MDMVHGADVCVPAIFFVLPFFRFGRAIAIAEHVSSVSSE